MWCVPGATSQDSHRAWIASYDLRPSRARNIATTPAEYREMSPSDLPRLQSKSDQQSLELSMHVPLFIVRIWRSQVQNTSRQDARHFQKLQILSNSMGFDGYRLRSTPYRTWVFARIFRNSPIILLAAWVLTPEQKPCPQAAWTTAYNGPTGSSSESVARPSPFVTRHAKD